MHVRNQNIIKANQIMFKNKNVPQNFMIFYVFA